MQPIPYSGLLREYADILIKVKEWDKFQPSDIERNNISPTEGGAIPDFVTNFERKLERKSYVSRALFLRLPVVVQF